jgi:DNA repair ATPase RecN
MPLDQTVLDDFKRLLQQVYDGLDEDIWTTQDATVQASINDMANSLNDALTALNQLEMGENDAALQAIKSQVTDINKQLQDAKAKIDAMVKDFAAAAKVAGLIDKAIEAGAKLVK